ncbi:unnamed protein product [Vitrella brassicaformis CCMP3155]|uniref:Cyclin C-terminal domain-containing protein n=1 Tax=Vitrella brassicaformis (strain CCMP3155) TaxID=1169540 RepID=A0A0G4F9T8_VITBC|nr:unnamed protein product [Vitrella brassicaformis CCMP3155]|eukprot:CEM09038.1 unnamed protein product [Vitrella brassicaformis CCMP3155]
MAAVTVGSMKWPQQRAVLVDGIVKRAASMGCRDATVMRAVRLLDLCHTDGIIDTDNATQVAVACVAACVKRLEPHLLMDDMPDDPSHTRAQVVGRAAADSSVCGIGCLEKLFTDAGMDTHGRLFSVAKYLMFLSMCEVELAGCDVRLLAATAVYITRKNHQDQIRGRIWSAALVAESSVSEAALESAIATLRMQRLLWRDTQTTKGIVTDAVDEMFASADRHGVALTHSHPQQERQQQDGNKDHPLAHFFVDDRCCIPDISTTLQLRAAAPCFRKAFSPTQLRNRLHHSIAREGIDTQLVQFDTSLGMGELMAAVWIAEEGGRWAETREVLQWASQCRYCTLPIMLTADDINTHASKTLMVVGRHVAFGDGSCLQIFRHANGEVRAIKDEPGFRLTVNPVIPAHQLYQQHRLQHDPPVESRIEYWAIDGRWVSSFPFEYPSVSSFAKDMILSHFAFTHQINRTSIRLNRYVGGGRLDGLLTQSPHTQVAGCTTTYSWDGRVLDLVLTDSSHNFVAWIPLEDMGNDNVLVSVETSEAAVCGSGAFKDRYPVTIQLARVALGRVAPYVFDGQVPTMAAMMRAVQVTVSD